MAEVLTVARSELILGGQRSGNGNTGGRSRFER